MKRRKLVAMLLAVVMMFSFALNVSANGIVCGCGEEGCNPNHECCGNGCCTGIGTGNINPDDYFFRVPNSNSYLIDYAYHNGNPITKVGQRVLAVTEAVTSVTIEYFTTNEAHEATLMIKPYGSDVTVFSKTYEMSNDNGAAIESQTIILNQGGLYNVSVYYDGVHEGYFYLTFKGGAVANDEEVEE